jgi:hypothetical protein
MFSMYCHEVPICPKAANVQESFEFVQYLGYKILIHDQSVNPNLIILLHVKISPKAPKQHLLIKVVASYV